VLKTYSQELFIRTSILHSQAAYQSGYGFLYNGLVVDIQRGCCLIHKNNRRISVIEAGSQLLLQTDWHAAY